jgi:hypothetical protein
MRDLGGKRQNECEHVYTTSLGCVAAKTRLSQQVSGLQKLTADLVGQRIALEGSEAGRTEGAAGAGPRLLREKAHSL